VGEEVKVLPYFIFQIVEEDSRRDRVTKKFELRVASQRKSPYLIVSA
jgi:hypothetical protein